VLSKYDPEQVKQEIEAAFDCLVADVMVFNEDVVEISRSDLMALRKPDHPWSATIKKIAETILNAD
jgi:hypothetical protein